MSANQSSEKFPQNNVLYSKTISGHNGIEYCESAKITVIADPDGVIRTSKTYEGFIGAVPGKIQFHTANDDGKLYVSCEIDKAGRFTAFRQIWSITHSPSGIPLMLISCTDDLGSGAAINMRRARGNYWNPKSVIKDDKLFNISWYAHDGQSYKETITMYGVVTGDVQLGKIDTELNIEFLVDNKKQISLSLTKDSELKIDSISALHNSNLSLKSPLKLLSCSTETERDKIISNPEPGTLIYIDDIDTIQVYKKKGWVNLL
jgi:hypothetical protein